MDEGNTLSLTELATKSHNPPGWLTQTIEIKPAGRAPKDYGPSTYKLSASMTVSVILPRRGWTLIKKTKNYAYLKPPQFTTPPFFIEIAVPTAEICLAMAKECYLEGKSWMGQLGEWPAWYFHERNTDMHEIKRDPNTGYNVTKLIKNKPKSSLHIGEWGVWEIQVTGEAGQFVMGRLPPSLHQDFAKNRMTFTEGTPREVTLNSYERSEEARKLCLEHYGHVCQACDLIYEVRYGLIGRDLIHVHHITPIAEIGETYQVDPIQDLVPLCASCHHVVHSRTPPYSVDEIRAAIMEQSTVQKP